MCKNRKTGTITIKSLDIKIQDDYDFHWHWVDDLKKDGSLFTWLGNNYVYLFGQATGLVKKYRANAFFKETRTSF